MSDFILEIYGEEIPSSAQSLIENQFEKLFSQLLEDNEIKYKLEQLRALDNQIKINVALAKSSPIGVDTEEDFVAIKKIMEYKSQ